MFFVGTRIRPEFGRKGKRPSMSNMSSTDTEATYLFESSRD
jgi:hypothetical protein